MARPLLIDTAHSSVERGSAPLQWTRGVGGSGVKPTTAKADPSLSRPPSAESVYHDDVKAFQANEDVAAHAVRGVAAGADRQAGRRHGVGHGRGPCPCGLRRRSRSSRASTPTPLTAPASPLRAGDPSQVRRRLPPLRLTRGVVGCGGEGDGVEGLVFDGGHLAKAALPAARKRTAINPPSRRPTSGTKGRRSRGPRLTRRPRRRRRRAGTAGAAALRECGPVRSGGRPCQVGHQLRQALSVDQIVARASTPAVRGPHSGSVSRGGPTKLSADRLSGGPPRTGTRIAWRTILESAAAARHPFPQSDPGAILSTPSRIPRPHRTSG